MLITKLVIRILDIHEQLLGWAEVPGEAHGDGAITVVDPTFVLIEQEGVAGFLSVHWCDVNIEVRSLVERRQVKFGEMLELPGNWPAIVCGPAAGGLPSVTVRQPVSIALPVGALGAKGRA